MCTVEKMLFNYKITTQSKWFDNKPLINKKSTNKNNKDFKRRHAFVKSTSKTVNSNIEPEFFEFRANKVCESPIAILGGFEAVILVCVTTELPDVLE